MTEFSKLIFPVEMTGAHWFALLAKIEGKQLSKEGEALLRSAVHLIVAECKDAAGLTKAGKAE